MEADDRSVAEELDRLGRRLVAEKATHLVLAEGALQMCLEGLRVREASVDEPVDEEELEASLWTVICLQSRHVGSEVPHPSVECSLIGKCISRRPEARAEAARQSGLGTK
eukprot:228285-Prymnesium_polylepis.1